MRALARAMGTTPEGSRELIERCQGLIAWIDVDAELAALLERPAEELAGTRGGATSAALEFTIADGTCAIELDMSDEAVQGQILGGRAIDMHVRSPDGSTSTVAVDEQGFFDLGNPPRGTIRLELELDDGRRVHSDWFVV